MSVDGALKAFDRLEDKYIALEKKYKRLREKNKAETRELEKARAALAAENERLTKVVKRLAEWSIKYPRGSHYNIKLQPQMDGELIEIEQLAADAVKEE